MTQVLNPAACTLCGAALDETATTCEACHASGDWIDVGRAIEFAVDNLRALQQRGVISKTSYEAAVEHYTSQKQAAAQAASAGKPISESSFLPSRHKCICCDKPVDPVQPFCTTCGTPVASPMVNSLRYLVNLGKEIRALHESGPLPLAEAHACIAEVRGRMSALRELEQCRVSGEDLSQARLGRLRQVVGREVTAEMPEERLSPVFADVPAAPPAAPSPAAAPTAKRRTLMEILLDPRSIQWLLASGGVLLVAGLVIWLASLGIFENQRIVATLIGAGTMALLAGGCAVVRMTRYQLAGRAVTLLACLVMPLNLWFYHAHNLITLDDHLWIAAVVCCILYAAAAWVLKDPMLVYVLMGGVSMTGLLILGDLGKFSEITSPSTLLVVLGLIGIHGERAFAEGETPFSRKRFGMASFWSGQALLAAGLLLLLGAQVVGYIGGPLLRFCHLATPPEVVTASSLRLLSLALIVAGAYAYAYSDLVVRKIGAYVYPAAFCLLWAEIVAMWQWKLPHTAEVLIGALALTALAANVVQTVLARSGKAVRTLWPLGLGLGLLPVLMGVGLHLRATNRDLYEIWPYSLGWSYVLVMALAAGCCREAVQLYRKSAPRLAAAYFFGTAAAVLVACGGLLVLLGIKSWAGQAPLLMLIPIGYLLASHFYADEAMRKALLAVARTASAVMLIAIIGSATDFLVHGLFEPASGPQLNLLLALFFVEAAIFYLLAAAFVGLGFHVYIATAMGCAAVWQVLVYWHVGAEYYTLAFALLGLGLLVVYRTAMLERSGRGQMAAAAFQCANGLMSVAFVAGALRILNQLYLQGGRISLLWLPLAMGALCLAASALVRHAGGRRWYIVMAIAQGALASIALHQLLKLSVAQNIEMFAVLIGLLLLITGHIGWYREQDQHNDMVNFSLPLGSLLAGVPLLVATLVNRFSAEISMIDELGLLTVSVLMFVSGVVLRIRATTLTGGSLLCAHLIMLLVFAGWKMQLAIGVYLTAGGAAIFGAGVLLSIYRERLLILPEQIRRREGVFRVLSWR